MVSSSSDSNSCLLKIQVLWDLNALTFHKIVQLFTNRPVFVCIKCTDILRLKIQLSSGRSDTRSFAQVGIEYIYIYIYIYTHTHTHTHTHIQEKPVEIQTQTIWNLIGGSTTAPPPVLSPSSILPSLLLTALILRH
jgi:hypothetical protein